MCGWATGISGNYINLHNVRARRETVCNKLSPGVNDEIYNDIINVFASDMPGNGFPCPSRSTANKATAAAHRDPKTQFN